MTFAVYNQQGLQDYCKTEKELNESPFCFIRVLTDTEEKMDCLDVRVSHPYPMTMVPIDGNHVKIYDE